MVKKGAGFPYVLQSDLTVHRSLQWIEIPLLLLFLAWLPLSSPTHSCMAVFLCRDMDILSQWCLYVCAESERVLMWSICKIGNACGLHEYLRWLWLCVCVREGIFKPICYNMCVYVCSNAGGWVNCLKMLKTEGKQYKQSASPFFPWTNTQLKVQWETWAWWLQKVKIVQTEMSQLSTK